MIPCDYEWGNARVRDSNCAECVAEGVPDPRLTLVTVTTGQFALKCGDHPEHERTVKTQGMWKQMHQPGQIRWH